MCVCVCVSLCVSHIEVEASVRQVFFAACRCFLCVSQRAKLPSSRPADQLILERQKLDTAREKLLDVTKFQQSCDMKTSWLKSSDDRLQRRAVERRVQATLKQHDVHIRERRDRCVHLGVCAI